MSFVIGTNTYQLPVQTSDSLFINQGTVPVMLGTMRDNLAALGMALQPLASIVLGGGLQYYAVAPTAPTDGVEVDLIEGGSGFAPSPQQIVSILNTGALATAIGGAVPQPTDIATAETLSGARLVDTNPTLDSYTFNLGALPDSGPVLSCKAGVSFELVVTGVGAVGANGTAIVTLAWSTAGDAGAKVTYEVNTQTFAGGSVGNNAVVITDRCRGDSVQISCDAIKGSTSQLQYSFALSSRPVDRPRIYDPLNGWINGDPNQGADMLLGSYSSAQNGVLAINASGPQYLFNLTQGRIFIRTSVAVSVCTFTLSWGLGLYLPFVVKPAIGTDTFLEIPAPNRPLCVSVKNTGGVASAQYALEAWSTDD